MILTKTGVAVVCLVVGSTVTGVAARVYYGKAKVEAQARKDAEEEALEQAGLAQSRAATAKELENKLQAALGDNADLAREIERLLKVAPKVRVVYIKKAATGAQTAAGKPRPPEPTPASAEAPLPAPRCLLAEGDRGEVRVVEAQLETGAGNRVVVGAAQAWRVQPEPQSVVLQGPFRAELTEALAEPTTAAQGWPWWALGIAYLGGVATTAAVAIAAR